MGLLQLLRGEDQSLQALKSEVMAEADKLVGGQPPMVRGEEFRKVTPQQAAATRSRLVYEFRKSHQPVFSARNNKSGV